MIVRQQLDEYSANETKQKKCDNSQVNEVNEVNKVNQVYQNRELSWLKFNQRVLNEAEDSSVPICERLNFIKIFQSNLDEFYMVRVGFLHDQMLYARQSRDSKTGMSATEQLIQIYKKTTELLRMKDQVYTHVIGEFSHVGVQLITYHEIAYSDAVYLEEYFKKNVMPILNPQVVGKRNPFPFLINGEIYAVARLETKNAKKIGIISCGITSRQCQCQTANEVQQRLIPLPSEPGKYILLEELILHFLPVIYDRYHVKNQSLIRITRSADIDVDEAFPDERQDPRDTMQMMLMERTRLRAVKMECFGTLDDRILVYLCKQLKLRKKQIYISKVPLELSFFDTIRDQLRNQRTFFYEHRISNIPKSLVEGESIFSQIQKQDILLYYPYDSMRPFISFLKEASEDKQVQSIMMTLYRVAKNSQIVDSLIHATELGKSVTVLVELRARFDESNNIEWSRRLEEAGCNVIYGIDYYKVHSKLCLVTYRDGNIIRHLTQIGTGNYNEITARQYTDMSLMTAHEGIAADVADIFKMLCNRELVRENKKHLLVSPNCMENQLFRYMEEEIAQARMGNPAYIGIKVNSLSDKRMIDKLIACSCAGVRIDLIVRGICCLIPGIVGVTENIRVISIVGRYLEHARIYLFGTPDRDRIYLSSADFMTRNLVRRVEVAVPVYDEKIKVRLRTIIQTMREDKKNAHLLMSDGNYVKSESVKMCLLK